ncbi:MAG TPA: hypothetical protein DCO89_00800 [Clostridiales bacterium]|nr:hypothetical protein [Clostridiales bacterium]
MLTLLFRGVIIYVIIFLIFRLMGKRQLGQLQPFEFIVTLIIADLATIPMSEINVPLLHGVVPLITIALIHFLIGLLSRKSIKLRQIFNGKPIIVVSPNGVEYEALRQLNMDFNDLTEALREMNIFSFDEVQYAIIETNGQLTVLPNASNAPLTATDFKIKKEESALPIMLICDGRKIKKNMQIAKIDDNSLLKQIKKAGAFKIKDIMIATVDNNGKMYVQAKNKKYVTFNIKHFKGGENW